MHRRTLARLLAVVTAGASMTLVGSPAAHADTNLPTLSVPSSFLVDAAAQPFSFTVANGSPLPTGGTATIALSGVTGLSTSTVELTCSGAAATFVGTAGGVLTYSCPIATMIGQTSYTVNGTVRIKRGAQDARVGNGAMHFAVSTQITSLLGASNGSNTADIVISTPPSISESPAGIRADGLPHTIVINASNHSLAAGQLGRVDLALSGLTGQSASTVQVAVLGAGGTSTPVTLTGSSTLTGELTPHTGLSFLTDQSAQLSYTITVAKSLHGGTLNADLTFKRVDSTGATLGLYDEDIDAIPVVNKPTVTTTIPAGVVVGAAATSFTQTVANPSGTDIAAYEVHYHADAPASVPASSIKLTGAGAALPAGSDPYTWIYTPATQGLSASGVGVDTAMTLQVVGATSGLIHWTLTVVDAGNHTTILSDASVPTTAAQTAPAAPTGLTTLGSNRTIAVAFNPGDTGLADPVSFVATATPKAGGAPVKVTGTSSPIVIPGLLNNLPYSVTVHTVNALGTSPESVPADGTPSPSVPGAPTIVGIAAGDGVATLVFSPPTDDGGSTVTQYRASYFPTDGSDGGSSVIDDALDFQITLPGLKNGVNYTVVLKAVNAIGSGAPSNSATFTPQIPGGPTNPAGVKVSIGATSATVVSGGKVTLSGIVVRNSDPQANLTVVVTFKGGDKKVRTVGTVSTDTFGAWQVTDKPKIRGTYTASVTSVSPAVASSGYPMAVTAVVKGGKLALKSRKITASGTVTPGSTVVPRVQLQVVKVSTVHGVKVTQVVKVLANGTAKKGTSGNAFSFSTGTLKPGTYLVRIASFTNSLLSSGVTTPVTLRVT